MGADEEGTLKILAAHRAVIDGIIQILMTPANVR